MNHITFFTLFILLSCLSYSGFAKSDTLSTRMDHLEDRMNQQNPLTLLSRFRSLQKETQQLHDLLKIQANTIDILTQQQGELYLEFNKRLNQLEGVTHKSTAHLINKEDASTTKIIDKPATAVIKPMSEKERQTEQKAYQFAYHQLQAHEYHQARELFTAFINTYPNGHYAHLAQYWIAESSYTQHHYKQAIIDYQRLLDSYPFSSKQAEATLKKAYSLYELENKKEAKSVLNQILIDYPNTTEANQAKRLLKKL